MPVLNIAEAAEQPQGATSQSEGDEMDTAPSKSSQQDVGTPVAINGKTDQSVTEDGMAHLPSQSSEEQEGPVSRIESLNGSQETEERDLKDAVAKKTTKKKYMDVLDSDSEPEDDYIASLLNKSRVEESDSLLESKVTKSGGTKGGRGARLTIDSESEEEESINAAKAINSENKDSLDGDESSSELATKKAMKSRFRTLVDSESEDDRELKASQNSHEESDDKASSDGIKSVKRNKKQKISSIVDSTSEDEEDSKKSGSRSSAVKNKKTSYKRNKKTKADKTEAKSKISSLIDTDSEEDDKRDNVNRSPLNEQHEGENHEKKTEKSVKKRTGSIRASKDEAMRQIHSETQRLIRSTEVSLPYHRPKQRSLQEFLNRKQFIPALPAGLTNAEKVKMSSHIVGKVLAEKEKEAELFYKSSDSEDDETLTSIPANPDEENPPPSSIVSPDDHCNIEDTQRILKNDVQNAHNKKEIIKQGAVDLGFPRKLFANDDAYQTENQLAQPEQRDDDDDENFDGEDLVKKTKEIKHGLREASVPRKLFANDYDEAVASTIIDESPSSVSPSNQVVESRINPSEIVDSSKNENSIDFAVPTDEPLSINTQPKLSNRPNDENIQEARAISTNPDTEKNLEFTNISDTPFISNKEYAKLNVKTKTSRQNLETDDNTEEDDNSKHVETPMGHVYGLPPPEIDDEEPEKSKLSMIKKKILSTVSSVGPKLRGSPGTFIDLTNDSKPNRDGVQSLVERFIRHSTVNKPTEINSTVTVLHTEKTCEGLRIIEQTLPYKLPTTDDINDKELSKPGAKHRRLKNELIERMTKKRGEEWKLKKQQEDENLDEEMEDDEFDDEEEEEEEVVDDEKLEISGESEPEDEEDEEEEEEMSSKNKKKRRPRNFADEEAEVSGDEDNEDDDEDEDMEVSDEDDKKDKNESKKKDNTKYHEKDENSRESSSTTEDSTANRSKKPSRILKAFDDDSNSFPEFIQPTEKSSSRKTFERTKTDVDMFASEDGNDGGWSSDTEAEIPPSQILPRDQADARSQSCKTPLTAVNILRFVSPITQLTAFNFGTDSPNEADHTAKITPGPNTVPSSMEKTPMEKQSPITINSDKRNSFQKKLFDDPTGTINDDELMDLCSGKFTGNDNDDNSTMIQKNLSSGFFSSQVSNFDDNEKHGVEIVDEASQDIRLTLDGDSKDSCDKIIDEEGVEKSKTPWTGFKVVSSSDEDDDSRENRDDRKDRKKRLNKKRVKKLELSDDEDEKDGSSNDDDEEEEFGVENNDNENKYVDYDSEENEVVIVPEKGLKKVAAGFLDEEAELSESEWGSADEDEKDLDKLELEEGDDEEIDENQMKDQLGKLHARQVMDDDQRDVRMLQEMLFDDGDLHNENGGRERQFKWKNIDNLGDDEKPGPHDDDVDENGDTVEEENDLEWRKQRLEREKFIAEKMKNSTDIANDGLESDSQIFSLGMKALKKSKSMQNSQKETEEAPTKKPYVPRNVLDLLGCSNPGRNSKILSKSVKRGSFLARGDECLARLAIQIKHSETTISTRTNNPRNFVFTHISPAVAGTAGTEEDDETARNVDSPANTKTKKRKPPAGVTPRTAKKAKIEVTRTTGKKLF